MLNLKFSERYLKTADYSYNSHNHKIPKMLCTNYDKCLNDLNLKFNRRIERFNNILKSNKKIYLLRIGNINQEECIILFKTLLLKYNKINLSIIAISRNDKKFIKNWKIPNIFNFYIEPELNKYMFYNKIKVIFENLNII